MLVEIAYKGKRQDPWRPCDGAFVGHVRFELRARREGVSRTPMKASSEDGGDSAWDVVGYFLNLREDGLLFYVEFPRWFAV